MIFYLVCGDILSLGASALIAILTKLIATGQMDALQAYLSLTPLLLPFFLLVFAAMGLYSGISLGSPEELRRLTLSSGLVSVLLAVLTFSVRGTGVIFTWTMAEAFLLSVILVPLVRVFIRINFSKNRWWGYPALVYADPETDHTIVSTLVSDPGLGLKPVGVVSFRREAGEIRGVPVISIRDVAAVTESCQGRAYLVLCSNGRNEQELRRFIDEYRKHFSHIVVITSVPDFCCLSVNPKNIGGILALEVCQQVFLPSRRLLKRSIDLLLTCILAIFVAPLAILIAIAIRIDSRGPVFYPQRRIGRGGREFSAWKFRSMMPDADARLAAFLRENPEMREEWARQHKLSKDPRITRIGSFLRSTSLDELPQLWNILRGEMSLVGPRPIVKAEIDRYGQSFETYTYVPSGLTGLWQVSGRSDTTYAQRVQLDCFYVNNWSVWLDLCILFRTIGVVLSRSGAV